jgi:hypothetical protein
MNEGTALHSTCRRATWHYDRSTRLGEWRCFKCQEVLAVMRAFETRVDLRHDLGPLPMRDELLPVYGLPKWKTARGKQPSTRDRFRFRGLLPLPIAVYCPRPGVCGRLQHLHPDAAKLP